MFVGYVSTLNKVVELKIERYEIAIPDLNGVFLEVFSSNVVRDLVFSIQQGVLQHEICRNSGRHRKRRRLRILMEEASS
uniref:S1 motif domain-containing protein n=1 Tax=Angiostrongylus cantonensis TaxID=6313 RepID=A0A0K0D427_ANGCA